MNGFSSAAFLTEGLSKALVFDAVEVLPAERTLTRDGEICTSDDWAAADPSNPNGRLGISPLSPFNAEFKRLKKTNV